MGNFKYYKNIISKQDSYLCVQIDRKVDKISILYYIKLYYINIF